jgi:hypothetical protein
MAYRILHCGRSIENYYKCLEEGIAGFAGPLPSSGDIVYLAVKVGNVSLCGGRGKLGEPTDRRPWKDARRYPNSHTLEQIEYCEPFDISILKSVGGEYWSARYLQASKAINEQGTISLLEKAFQSRIRSSLSRIQE